ncbi:ABC transporter permease [Microvirga sp. W0021]|uniref:ABC transporter permease n=1 Tax=Hohaiivirga grylli TaxID=3133970 RepID=A0ABV0BKJ5_9HYPH
MSAPLKQPKSRWQEFKEQIANILWLSIKELRSIKADPILLILIIYTFTYAIYAVANGAKTEAVDMAIGIVDEDQSILSNRIKGAFLQPLFKEPVEISATEIDDALDTNRFVFVLDIPSNFEADVLSGNQPTVQLNIDATAMTQAGNGSNYAVSIISTEVSKFLSRDEATMAMPVQVVVRTKFNPNLTSSWFTSAMQVINNITMLAIILTGAALIREREHGTIEHLLVMPVLPTEIMLAKVLANGLVIVTAATLSLNFVVKWWMGVPVAGSIPLFVFGSSIYLFSIASLGILLATFSTSMAQFGLLIMPVLVVLNLLSGSTTPLESMPEWLQYAVQVSPTTQFVAFAQGVLYRGADLSILWPRLTALVAIGVFCFAVSLMRFRKVLSSS